MTDIHMADSARNRILSAARRETIDGLLVLHLAGAPYEMGLQHGALCRDEIHGFRREAYAYMARLVASALRLPLFLALPLSLTPEVPLEIDPWFQWFRPSASHHVGYPE